MQKDWARYSYPSAKSSNQHFIKTKTLEDPVNKIIGKNQALVYPKFLFGQTLGGYCCGYHRSATRCYGIPIGPGGDHEDNPKNKDPDAPRRPKMHGAKSFGTDSDPKNLRSVRQVIG